MYSLIEYSDNYSETSIASHIAEVNGAIATDSFYFKAKITGQTGNNGRIDDVEIIAPLKYLSNSWRTLEMPLINCEVNLILTWSANCNIIYTNLVNQNPTFVITEIKLYVPVVTLSTQDNTELFQ